MPVLLPPDRWEQWVDPGVPSAALAEAMGPFPFDKMRAREVSTYVNDPKHEGEACVASG
jgi:putative SOS response-associated peptidase YedK